MIGGQHNLKLDYKQVILGSLNKIMNVVVPSEDAQKAQFQDRAERLYLAVEIIEALMKPYLLEHKEAYEKLIKDVEYSDKNKTKYAINKLGSIIRIMKELNLLLEIDYVGLIGSPDQHKNLPED